MTILDTPDYSKPLPGGSRTLLSTTFNLSTSGGTYTSPWFDVTAFNGLVVKATGFALATSFGTLTVQFQDAAGLQALSPAHQTQWRGNLGLDINVPVMGAQARILITGASDNVTQQLLMVGHGGGGSSSYRREGRQLAGIFNQVIANGGNVQLQPITINEGPCHMGFATTGQPGAMQVFAQDQGGFSALLAQMNLAANSANNFDLWIPPQPLLLTVINTGAAGAAFYAGLWLGRT